MKWAALILVCTVGAWAEADHVVLIGIDGLGAKAVRENQAANLRRLMQADGQQSQLGFHDHGSGSRAAWCDL
jgi:hypothetical protein